jgi:hypothetical protein
VIGQVPKSTEEILELLDGKCEADPTRDCAWKLIYNRLKQLDELDKWREAKPVIKDYSKMARPRKIEAAPLVLLRQSTEGGD